MELSPVALLDGAGDDGRPELIDFVGQITASHLGRCRTVGFVYMEDFSSAGEHLLQHSSPKTVLTNTSCQNPIVKGFYCGIICASLSDEKDFSDNIFHASARLVYLINVGNGAPVSFPADFFTPKRKKWWFNTIVVVFNTSSHEGYYFDPVWRRLTKLAVPTDTIYPTSNQLRDLRGYDLHTAFIPGESDPLLIGNIMEMLAYQRNGSLHRPVPLQAVTLLEFSRRNHWQFSMVTVGPFAYATCFFVPRAGPVPIGYILVAPFDTGIWVGVLVTACLVVLLLRRFGQASRGSLASAIITLLQSVLTSPNRISRSTFERPVLTACSLGCVVLVSSYQSVIFSLISNPAYYPELDTEQQINRSCSLYVIGMDELGGIDTFRDSFFDLGSFRAGKSCVCTTCRLEQAVRHVPRLARLYRTSRHRTHPFPMLVALMDRHYPPLDELVERYVSGFFEAGLTEKLMVALRNDRSERRDHFRGGPTQQLRVADLHIVWIVLGIGLATAVGCFLGELAMKQGSTCKLLVRTKICGLCRKPN